MWRQWLQKYKLVSVQQIAAASTVEGLKELFQSAQTSESLIICLSDRANIKLFQGTCENMAKLLNAPANSEQHELFLQGLASIVGGIGVNCKEGPQAVTALLPRGAAPAAQVCLAPPVQFIQPVVELLVVDALVSGGDALVSFGQEDALLTL